jgi:hypothetical protein
MLGTATVSAPKGKASKGWGSNSSMDARNNRYDSQSRDVSNSRNASNRRHARKCYQCIVVLCYGLIYFAFASILKSFGQNLFSTSSGAVLN